MSPPRTNDSPITAREARLLAQDELNKRFIGLDRIITASTLASTLNNFVTKDSIVELVAQQINRILSRDHLFLTRGHLDRALADYVRRDRLEGTVTLVTQSKVFELLAIQTGLAGIMKDQHDQLQRASAALLHDTERHLDLLTDRVVAESLRTDAGSKLVEQMRRASTPSVGFYISVTALSFAAGAAGALATRLMF